MPVTLVNVIEMASLITKNQKANRFCAAGGGILVLALSEP